MSECTKINCSYNSANTKVDKASLARVTFKRDIS